MNNKCPKCHEKISPFYLKQNCPHCGVDLLYYKLDERLDEDAAESERQVAKLKRFANTIKASTIATPLLIIRLILFFTPLLSMCLPMYRAGHKNVSLIGFIMSIVNHGFDISAWSSDYLFAVLSMVLVIVLSLAVIINSLFSSTKNGTKRNFVFSFINTAVFGALSLSVCLNGGAVKVGFYVTLAIYFCEFLLHFLTVDNKPKLALSLSAVLCAIIAVSCALTSVSESSTLKKADGSAFTVVTFNTAAPWGTPFDDTAGSVRAVRFINYMNSVSPALIGTQELNSEWLKAIEEQMPNYESYAVKRGGDGDENTSEMNGIFWLKDRFDAVETETFWLSQTPEKESRFTYTDENGEKQEAGCNRICTYAVLKEKPAGKTIAFLNTHLDNSSEEAMEYGAKLIADKINELTAKYPDSRVVLTGDFNQTSDGAAYKALTAVLNDTTDPSKQQATWQDWGYTNTGDKPIDFIFTSAKGSNYRVLDNIDTGYVSDHYGVATDVSF
ncbi:MAG: hypothetical protein IJS03_08330 [Eubacterium sp.]|nr:hypothetical protein [Eubacterium sp.]